MTTAGLRELRGRTFSSLRVPNYRRYTAGQLVSLVGTWAFSTAQAWLVLQLTGSGTALGVVIALQTLPVLLLGPYAGVLIDRRDKQRLLVVTQVLAGALSAVLCALVLSGVVRLWMVMVVALASGCVNSVANPARQAFVQELVGPTELRNAVTLNAVLVNAARAVGPAIAAVLIDTAGVGWAFGLDALSYAAVVLSLVTLVRADLLVARPVARGAGQLREGLRYVRGEPALLVPLLAMAVVGTLTYEFQVSLPLLARGTFHGGATAYGLLTGASGVGAVVGGLWAAARSRTGTAALARTALLFGALVLAASAAPALWVAVVLMAGVGAASVTFLSTGNATLQLTADPAYRGRVMALWSVAFLGTTPLGGPTVGAVGEHVGARWGLALGGVAALAAGALALRAARRAPRDLPLDEAPSPVPPATAGAQSRRDPAAAAGAAAR